MSVLKKHVYIPEDGKNNGKRGSVFNQILRLKIGEAFVFAPSAITEVSTNDEEMEDDGDQELKMTADELFKVRMRKPVTWDGGASIVCV